MTLYAHQNRIIEDNPTKTGLFLGTGSGKTRIALLLARGSTLVICPKTQKEDGNWEREASSLGLKVPLTVISKEKFRATASQLLRYDTVIVDECHTVLGMTANTRYRNGREIPKASQLFEALYSYLRRTKPDRIYLLSATILKSPFTVFAARCILNS